MKATATLRTRGEMRLGGHAARLPACHSAISHALVLNVCTHSAAADSLFIVHVPAAHKRRASRACAALGLRVVRVRRTHNGCDNVPRERRGAAHSPAPPFATGHPPRSAIVANVINLDKTTLKVAPAEDDPRVLLLQFDFSASVPGYIAVYYCAHQIVHRKSVTDGTVAPVRRVSYAMRTSSSADIDAQDDAEAPPLKRAAEKTKFAPGLALRYQQKSARGLCLDNFDEAQLLNKVNDHYPVVIRIEARHPSDSTVPRRSRVVSQSTFAVLTRKSPGGDWGIKVVRQEVLVAGTIYVLQELYGIGAVDVTASRSPGASADSGIGKNVFSVDASNECVICLTEPCNTAVLPCNHLCLCQDCGAKLSTDPSQDRRRCPICRTDLESLLRIVPTSLTNDKDGDSQVSDTDSERKIKSSGPSDSIDALEVDAGNETQNGNAPVGGGNESEDRMRSENEDIDATTIEHANTEDVGCEGANITGGASESMGDNVVTDVCPTNEGRVNEDQTTGVTISVCRTNADTNSEHVSEGGNFGSTLPASIEFERGSNLAESEPNRTEQVVDEGAESSDSVKSTTVRAPMPISEEAKGECDDEI
eukprot:IDg11223t1